MLAPVHPAITRADYEAMSEGPPYFQLVQGQLIMSPSPFTRHQRLVFRLGSILNNFVQNQRLSEVFIAPLDVFLNEVNVYQPDIVFVSNARLHQVTEKGIEGAPDLCIEVLSKSTERFDKITKKKIFAQSGLQHYWLVDTEKSSITVFELQTDSENPAHIVNPPATFQPDLFPGLKIDLKTVFS